MTTKSLIIGSNGQDGRWLDQQLAQKNHLIWGLSRTSLKLPDEAVAPPINLHDQRAIHDLISRIQPDEIYFLAAVHHSAEDASISDDDLQKRSRAIHVTALKFVLNAMAAHAPAARLFYAASSHLFAGKTDPSPISEQTAFAPLGVYAITKLQGVELCRQARKEQNLWAASGFLFNHESAYRGIGFLSRKITSAAAAIAADKSRHKDTKLVLHDLGAQVDWSHAADCTRAMQDMVGMDDPMDMVIASGKLRKVAEFAQVAFGVLGMDWQQYVVESPKGRQKQAFAPLTGDASLLRTETGWKPQISFEKMIHEMVSHEMKL